MPTTFGAFSSAAAAGKLLGLDEEKMTDALGIAFMHAGGSQQINYGDGVGITPLYDCFLSQAGVLSALMAQRGISGVKDCLQSKAGVYNLYFRGEYDPNYLTDKLGERFEGINMGFKLYPTCRCTHVYITAALNLIREHNIRPEDVAEVLVSVGDWVQNLCCQPLEARRRPETSTFANLSIPFTVAAAIAEGEVTIGTFTPKGLKDPVTLAIAQKVVPRYDPQLNVPGIPPAIVEIKTRSGETYSARVDFPYGHPKNPVTMDDLVKKFRDCVSYSARPISSRRVEQAIESILSLEESDNVSHLIQFFT
jgi:2-methylcitrate dehydratase PrpD